MASRLQAEPRHTRVFGEGHRDLAWIGAVVRRTPLALQVRDAPRKRAHPKAAHCNRSTLRPPGDKGSGTGGPHTFRMHATRPHPTPVQTGEPLTPEPCRCDRDEPFGDPRDGTCVGCGRQVEGRPMPYAPIRPALHSDIRPARKRRTYGGAQ